MQNESRRIEFGIARSSAKYLVGGFSAVVGGRRLIGQRAAMRLCLPEGRANRLTLGVSYDRPQRIEWFLNGEPVGASEVTGTNRTEELYADVPAGLAQPDSLLEVRCASPHPLDRHVPRCLELLWLDVAEWDDPPEAEEEKARHNLVASPGQV